MSRTPEEVANEAKVSSYSYKTRAKKQRPARERIDSANPRRSNVQKHTPEAILLSKDWILSVRHQKEMMNVMDSAQLKDKVITWMFEFIFKPDSEQIENNSETILDFCREYAIPRSTLYYWADKDKEFSFYFNAMKLLLSNKLYKMALHRRVDKEVVFKNLYRLDPELDEDDQRQARLKKEIDINQRDTVIKAIKQVLAPFEEPDETKTDNHTPSHS